jgi:hypothetical protein
MALHLFRPADPPESDLSPSWKAWRGLLFVAAAQVLNCLARLCQSPRTRRLCILLGVFGGLVVQMGLVLTAAYLVDLSLSLMELWADLARKHLELTL